MIFQVIYLIFIIHKIFLNFYILCPITRTRVPKVVPRPGLELFRGAKAPFVRAPLPPHFNAGLFFPESALATIRKLKARSDFTEVSKRLIAPSYCDCRKCHNISALKFGGVRGDV